MGDASYLAASMGMLGDLGVIVLVCRRDMLCITKCACLLGGCNLCGVNL